MKVLLFLLLSVSAFSQSQFQRTETQKLKKIGDIEISLLTTVSGNDTSYSLSMTQMKKVMGAMVYGGVVSIRMTEIPGIITALQSFNEDVKKGTPKGDVANYYSAEITRVTCSYNKYTGWEFYFSNHNNETEAALEKSEKRTGAMMGQVITVKPRQIKDIVEVLEQHKE